MPIDYKNYHPKWKLISKLIRFRRANNRCEFEGCKAVNGQPHPITGSKVVLTVAHLDHDKGNNRFNNLKAACQRCHLMYDLARHIANRKRNAQMKRKQMLLFEYRELQISTITPSDIQTP